MENENTAAEAVMTENITQVEYPGRASRRTLVQTIVGLLLGVGVAAPAILSALTDGLRSVGAESLAASVATGGAVAAAIATGIARIMAVPGVEDWLQRTTGLRWLAATTVTGDQGPGDLGLDAAVSGYRATDLETDENLTTEAGEAALEAAEAEYLDPVGEGDAEPVEDLEGPGYDGEDLDTKAGA